jgi:hypothetical protein
MPHAEDTSEPVPMPMSDPRGTAGDELIPQHLNPTAQLGAEVTRKYISPLEKARFGKLYGETTWVRGEGPGRLFEEGHPAIEYNTEEQMYDPLASKQTMKHELEHAGVMQSLTYQEHWQENSEFQLAGGEELRQRLSDVERIQAYGPSAMKQGTYRAQLKDAHTMIARLTKSLGEKFNMTPEEVSARVKSYQADINQAVKKAEAARQQKLGSGSSTPTPSGAAASTQHETKNLYEGPKGKVDEDTHTRWHQHRHPIKITNNSGDYDMHWTDQNTELSTAPL